MKGKKYLKVKLSLLYLKQLKSLTKNNLQAVYYLKKITLLPNLVKKGDVIGLTDSESISYLNNYNLGFALLAKDNREIPADGIEFR